jgi:membrane-associated protease RseP (regulator of RpoE activity)
MHKALGFGLIIAVAGAGCAWAAAGEPHGRGQGRVGVFFMAGASANGGTRSTQGYLGVDVRDVTNDQVNTLRLKEARGAEITLVDHDAPAGKAGLREHDVVLKMNGQPVQGEEQIRRMLRESAPGKTVVLLISRDGQQITVTTQMANREAVERQAWERHLTMADPADGSGPATESASSGSYQSGAVVSGSSGVRGNSFIGRILPMTPSYTGAMMEPLNKPLAEFFGSANGTGLLVRKIDTNSPAAQAGMKVGDVVVRANAQSIASTKDWTKAIEASHGHSLSVIVLRDKKETTLSLTPDTKKHSKLEMLLPPWGENGDVALSSLSWFC